MVNNNKSLLKLIFSIFKIQRFVVIFIFCSLSSCEKQDNNETPTNPINFEITTSLPDAVNIDELYHILKKNSTIELNSLVL